MFETFREIVVIDTEFEAHPGERPVPICLVAKETPQWSHVPNFRRRVRNVPTLRDRQ